MATWSFQFGDIGIRKKEFIAFRPVDERIADQSKDSLNLYFGKKKKKKKKDSTETFLQSLYQGSVCLVNYVVFLDGVLC